MKVPYSWLREIVPGLPADPTEVARRLSDSGTYVEAIHQVGVADASNGGGAAFKVGVVRELEQHPDADKLKVAKVDIGDGELHQIVCGAPNVAAGETVAVVLPGGTMPDGMRIKEAKLRGVESRGMMMSERELQLSTDHSGLMLLDKDLEIGTPLNDVFPIGDHVLELEITGNRPDCLGMLGVALEAGAAMDVDLIDMSPFDVDPTATGDVSDHVTVEVEATDLCPRYMARAFVDVTVGQSPLWLKAWLARAGMRSINNIVDITNYVMLLTGQPLHAFDADKLRGSKIVVRRAREDEPVTTLDDVERTLGPDTLVIADAEQTAVIAGIMGAADVEVTATTTRIVLEAATFDGHSIQRSSRELGLRSESSSRFEKGLDPYSPSVAMGFASRMLVEICGASLVPGTIDVQSPDGLDQAPTFEMDAELPSRILGIDIDDADIQQTLARLGFGAIRGARGWAITVPHARMYDVTRPIDVVEELGRFRLEQIPSELPPIRTGGAVLTRLQRLRRLLEDTSAGLGLNEVVTYGLVGPGTGEALGNPEETVVRLANPMTVDHAEMRTALFPGHLEVARRNHAAGTSDVAIFEIGRTYYAADPVGSTGADGLPRYSAERDVLALLVTGSLGGARWDLPGLTADYPAVAGLVASLLAATGIDARFGALPNPPAWVHPGQVADVRAANGAVLGWVGAIHPRFAAQAGVDADVFAAHLDLHAIDAARTLQPRFTAYSEFPPVMEDIAIVLDDAVAGGEVVTVAREAGGALLESVSVFDRYVGDPIPAGRHSLALRLTFRAPDRTLTDEETAAVRGTIVDALAQRFGAELRG
ncbi:MAG: phenylalanine--tRNA ligase subunit beta [Thermoleophilia bacterium]|nr:phenylalanine--tRNA ligase subunit beta [Thermoleophilia bacterium]